MSCERRREEKRGKEGVWKWGGAGDEWKRCSLEMGSGSSESERRGREGMQAKIGGIEIR